MVSSFQWIGEVQSHYLMIDTDGGSGLFLRWLVNGWLERLIPTLDHVYLHSLPLLSQEAFFNNVLFHELSHSLGPAFVGNNEANGEVGT